MTKDEQEIEARIKELSSELKIDDEVQNELENLSPEEWKSLISAIERSGLGREFISLSKMGTTNPVSTSSAAGGTSYFAHQRRYAAASAAFSAASTTSGERTTNCAEDSTLLSARDSS